MAGVAVFTRRFEFRVRMVRPDIGGLHAAFSVLTVGNGVSGQFLHEPHFPQATSGVFNKPVFRSEFPDEFHDMGVNPIAPLGVFGYGSEVSVLLSISMLGYRRHRVGGAVWRSPHYIRSAETFDDIVRSECADIGVKIDAIETFVPIHGKYFVACGFERLADRAGPGE